MIEQYRWDKTADFELSCIYILIINHKVPFCKLLFEHSLLLLFS